MNMVTLYSPPGYAGDLVGSDGVTYLVHGGFVIVPHDIVVPLLQAGFSCVPYTSAANGPTGSTGATGAGPTGSTGSTGATGTQPFSTVGNDVTYAAGSLVLPKTVGVGIKVDPSSPTFAFADILGPVQTRASGGTIPTFAAYQGGIFQYSFGTAPGITEIFNEYHIPHDIVPGSDMFIHCHWSTIAAPTGNANWIFECTYAKGYGQAGFSGTGGAANTPNIVQVTAAGVAAFQHEISEVIFATAGGLVDPTPGVNVSITSGAAILTAASALFTAGDIDRTIRILGAGVAAGVLDTTISAFTSTTQVTLAANASTTVTTQPNYRQRVLDANLIEPDGLILVRTYRNSARAADTLNVAPFVHFVDLHYQTNGMIGTKTKNFPFYT